MVVGRAHGDTVNFALTPTFDPLNMPYLSKIETIGIEYSNKIRCTYTYPNGSTRTSSWVGGNYNISDSTPARSFNISKDEYVNKVHVSYGAFVDSITFVTNK